MLAALSRERRVKILQRPRIQTSDAVPATLFVGEQRSYPGFYCGSDRYAPIQELQTGVTLNVTPALKPDGVVQMNLQLRIDRFEGNVTIQNVGSVPVTSTYEAQAQVAVRDRETLLLGGLPRAHKQKSVSSLRFPKDLPVPGALSSRTSARFGRSEFMVLVRPTLLPH
jgi:type II secretory pathway component GspD/PulD (secretin)